MSGEFADMLPNSGPSDIFGDVAKQDRIGHAFTGDVVGLLAMPFHELDGVLLNALTLLAPTPPPKHVLILFILRVGTDLSKAWVKQIVYVGLKFNKV